MSAREIKLHGMDNTQIKIRCYSLVPLAVRIKDFLLLMCANKRLTKQSMGQILHCFCKVIRLHIAFT